MKVKDLIICLQNGEDMFNAKEYTNEEIMEMDVRLHVFEDNARYEILEASISAKVYRGEEGDEVIILGLEKDQLVDLAYLDDLDHEDLVFDVDPDEDKHFRMHRMQFEGQRILEAADAEERRDKSNDITDEDFAELTDLTVEDIHNMKRSLVWKSMVQEECIQCAVGFYQITPYSNYECSSSMVECDKCGHQTAIRMKPS